MPLAGTKKYLEQGKPMIVSQFIAKSDQSEWKLRHKAPPCTTHISWTNLCGQIGTEWGGAGKAGTCKPKHSSKSGGKTAMGEEKLEKHCNRWIVVSALCTFTFCFDICEFIRACRLSLSPIPSNPIGSLPLVVWQGAAAWVPVRSPSPRFPVPNLRHPPKDNQTNANWTKND